MQISFGAVGRQVILLCLLLAVAKPSLTFAQGFTSLATENEISTAESVELLMQQIALVEAAEDTFSSRLGELSFDLGVQLATLGLNDEALHAFQRADQNMKVREGLYSNTREIIVRKVHEQHIALNDWDAAEVALENIAWIQARNLDATSVEYVEVLQELVEWNLARDYYDIDEEDQVSISLRRAHSDLEEIYQIYWAKGLPYDTRTVELSSTVNYRLSRKLNIVADRSSRRNVAANDARRFRRQFDAVEGACQSQYPDLQETSDNCISIAEQYLLSKVPETVVYDTFNSSGGDYAQSEMFFSRSYLRGRELLLDQLTAYRRAEDNANTLEVLLGLGDWYLLFGYQRYAEEVYATAWHFATNERLGALIDMSIPQPILIAGVIQTLPELRVGNRQGAAEAAVTIGADGQVQTIEFSDTDIEDESAIAELAAEFSLYRYRPALQQGVPVEAHGYLIDTQLYY